MTNSEKPLIYVDVNGPIDGAPAASTFGKGAKDGRQVVAEHRARGIGEYRGDKGAGGPRVNDAD